MAKPALQGDDSAAFFHPRFFDQYAGRLITDPAVAVVELVANSWDAAATEVHITWPENTGDLRFEIYDNGTGMTDAEFCERWKVFAYNRLQSQGNKATFPGDNGPTRHVFGCNGKGRHSMFCFNDHYSLETWRDGQGIAYEISRQSQGNQPWRVGEKRTFVRSGHGTRLWTDARNTALSSETLRALIGGKFLTDPTFQVYVNDKAVSFEDLADRLSTDTIGVLGYGQLEVVKVNSTGGRTAKPHGVAWWVNNRLVGKPSWDGIDGSLLDGRTYAAKSLTFIVRANLLKPVEDVSDDWERLKPSDRTNAVRKTVLEHVSGVLRDESRDARRQIKRSILSNNSNKLRRLPILSQEKVAAFIGQVSESCRTVSNRDLANVAQLLIRLEESASGYELLGRLAGLEPNDLDAWNSVIAEWTAHDAKVVLDELKRRLDLIERLDKLVEKSTTDELHQLQPIFEKGLWIFGPEFESVEFMSNRTLAAIIRELLGGGISTIPSCRPDFVALPDASIGVFARDSFHPTTHEVDGLAKVVIVELKRGAFRIGSDEKFQAMRYAKQLKNGGKVQKSTVITAFVLGASVELGEEEPITEGLISIVPRPYEAVIRQAHARTFNLKRRLLEAVPPRLSDPDLQWAMQPDDLFVAAEVCAGETEGSRQK